MNLIRVNTANSLESCFDLSNFFCSFALSVSIRACQPRFALRLGLGVFGFQLSDVGLDRCHVPFILSVFHFPKAVPQNHASQRFHACVHRSGPLLVHLGDHSDLAGRKGLRDVREKVVA